ncbi:MAG: DUF1295 domain-containing protein [Pseudomonadota bacterium]
MSERSNSKITVAVLISIAIGAGVAIAGSDGSQAVAGWPIFALCGALAFVINWLVFVPSAFAQTEKFYDLTGGLTYLTVTAVACLSVQELDQRAFIVAGMVVVWAGRLASFLFLRISKDGKDGRFDDIKTRPWRFFMTWTLQGLWVLLTAACALAIITSETRVPMEILGWVGAGIWLVGFLIEAIADRQKSAFKSDPDNHGKFITTGLWSWSRHPNYFGEIVLWVGVAVMALPVLQGWQWVTLISPVFVTFLLTKVSGIPMLEARAEERWGDDPEFRRYTDNTSVLVPLPPKG